MIKRTTEGMTNASAAAACRSIKTRKRDHWPYYILELLQSQSSLARTASTEIAALTKASLAKAGYVLLGLLAGVCA